MAGKGGRTGTTWEPGWHCGKTTPIRVPIALKDDILAYARAVDSKLISNSQPIPLPGDFLQAFTIRVIDRYIAWRCQNYRSTQNSYQPDTSARTWDEMRKFRQMVETSFDKLDKTTAE